MNQIMHCWPPPWLRAAVKAGLAHESMAGPQIYNFVGGDDMRDRVEVFATAIVESMQPGASDRANAEWHRADTARRNQHTTDMPAKYEWRGK